MSEYIVRETGYPGAVKQEVVGELVRCKDCRHLKQEFQWNGMPYKTCEFHVNGYPDDWYCADGERKADADK